jgi:hypothetical protein
VLSVLARLTSADLSATVVFGIAVGRLELQPSQKMASGLNLLMAAKILFYLQISGWFDSIFSGSPSLGLF